MTSLWLFGDSFSAPHHPQSRAWYDQAALDQGMAVENHSLPGTAQDYTIRSVITALDQIQPGDRVIITLTHPNRFWYSLEHPSLSNHHIIALKDQLGREHYQAIEYYRRYIQRPDLDLQWQAQRMAWLSVQVQRLGLAPILILQCFPGPRLDCEAPGLQWAQGDLFTLSQNEFKDEDPQADRIFHGIDARYNHLSGRNHDILADRISMWLEHGTEVDLTKGYHERFLDQQLLEHEDYLGEIDRSRLGQGQKKGTFFATQVKLWQTKKDYS